MSPTSLPTEGLNDGRVDWRGHQWLVARQSLRDPSVDIYAGAPLDPFLASFAHTAIVGSIALGITAFVVVALTVAVTGRLTRSLGDLAVAADRVTHGDFDARVAVSSSGDEVGRVSRTFNAMVENLRTMMSERSQREAVAAMGELAATLAHQLRSPATAMRLDVQRAHDKLDAQSPQRTLLARALTQLDRMERAITGSLRVARSAGATFDVISIVEPLDRAIAAASLGSERPPVTKATIPDALARVRGDASSLEQLFGNLLTNALQATSPPGSVHVSLETPDHRVAVTIRDEGAGMAPDVLRRAGEPLFSTKPEGTGLGLAIAKRIAAAHGGSISIESTVGVGTTVRVDLPRVV